MFSILNIMSRIGRKPIPIPAGVAVTVGERAVEVKGPKGTLIRSIHPAVSVRVDGAEVMVDVPHKEDKKERALWGTFAAHIRNMIAGVTVPYKKQLEVQGVGFRVALQGKDLKLDIGFSHPVMFVLPTDVTASVEKNVITLESADKECLGKVAAEIRNLKKPEPYKGKGIKYMDEVIRRKAGKAAKAAAA